MTAKKHFLRFDLKISNLREPYKKNCLYVFIRFVYVIWMYRNRKMEKRILKRLTQL